MVPIEWYSFVLVITHHFGWLVVYHSCNFLILVKKKVESIYTILFWILKNGYVNPKVIYVIRFWFFFQPPHPDLQHGAITSYSVGYRLANSSEPYRYATVDARDPHVKKAYFSSSKNLVGLCLHVCSHGSTPNSIYFLFSIDPLEMENRTIENLHQIRHYPASFQCAWCRTQKWRVGRYHHGRW